MARSIWKGSIVFGLVSIPVEVFTAEERKEFKFSMLDKKDFSPVGYKRYNKVSGKEIDWSGIVKGYEYDKDQYVVMTEEDFKRANVKASRTVDIQTFVPTAEIPAMFYDTPYYMVPSDRGEKVYALLRETLLATKRAGIAQFVMRTTQHLAAVIPEGRALMLYTLRYPDELKGTSGFELPAADLKEAHVTAKEIDLAKRLIDDMTGKWDPNEFHDSYHEDLMARIKEKIKKGQTKEITKPAGGEPAVSGSNVIDLAALLQKSIKGGTRKAAAADREDTKPSRAIVRTLPKKKRA